MCETGKIVRATAGRDKGLLFFVVGMGENGLLLLADGKGRKLSAPKRKKPAHVEPVDEGSFGHPTLDRLRRREQVSDRGLRVALAAFKGR